MAATRPTTKTEHARGLGAELWLARAGSAAELAGRLRAFEGRALGLVLCPPDGEAQRWGAAFATAFGAELELAPELAAAGAATEEEAHTRLGARAWSVLATALTRGPARLLAILPHAVLLAAVQEALALAPPGPAALRVDPGRLVLLCDAPGGILLRRANVLAPEGDPGTALPDGGRPAR
jgi:hypothetical protein